jgi:hypothetical protein
MTLIRIARPPVTLDPPPFPRRRPLQEWRGLLNGGPTPPPFMAVLPPSIHHDRGGKSLVVPSAQTLRRPLAFLPEKTKQQRTRIPSLRSRAAAITWRACVASSRFEHVRACPSMFEHVRACSSMFEHVRALRGPSKKSRAAVIRWRAKGAVRMFGADAGPLSDSVIRWRACGCGSAIQRPLRREYRYRPLYTPRPSSEKTNKGPRGRGPSMSAPLSPNLRPRSGHVRAAESERSATQAKQSAQSGPRRKRSTARRGLPTRGL